MLICCCFESLFSVCRHASGIVAAILNCWSSFDVWRHNDSAMDLKQSMLMILKKALILDPKVSKVPGLPVECTYVLLRYVCFFHIK